MKTFILLIAFFALNLHADEHGLTSIVGTDIQLQFHDHGIAGSVKERLVYGALLEDKFGSRVTIREGRGKEFSATFEKTDKGFGGVVPSTDSDSQSRTTSVKLISIDKNEEILYMEFNKEPVAIQITHEGIEGNHFINPHLTMTYQGNPVEFKIVDGSACWGCLVNITCMIMGAYIH